MTKTGVVTLLVGVLLAFSLGGVFAETVTVRVSFPDAMDAFLDPALERFMELNPNIRVESVQRGSPELEWHLTQQVGGNIIDVIGFSSSIASHMIDAGFAANLTPRLERDPELSLSDLVPTTVRMYQRGEDRGLYAIPYEFRVYVTTIEVDYFNEAGLQHPNTMAPEDWSWERMAEAARRLTLPDGSGGYLRYGVGVHDRTMLLLSRQSGGDWFDDEAEPSRANFRSEATLQAFEYVADLVESGSIVRGHMENRPVGISHNTTLDAVLRMVGAHPTQLGPNATVSVDPINYDVVRHPMGSVHNGTVFGSTGLLLNRESAQPDAAWEVIKFLTTDEEFTIQKNLQRMRPSAYIPNIQLFGPDYFHENLPESTVLINEILTSPHAATLPSFPGFDEIWDTYVSMFRNQLLTGSAPPNFILDELQRRAEVVLAAQ